MTPPAAKRYIAGPPVTTPPLPNRPPSAPLSEPSTSLATGLNALVTAMFDSRSASCFSTSSNCLPPVVASLKAFAIALANCVALTPSALTLVRVLSVVCARSSDAPMSVGSMLKASLIGISPHQIVERRARERRRGSPAHRRDGGGELARRHAPEGVRRQLEHAEAEAHC